MLLVVEKNSKMKKRENTSRITPLADAEEEGEYEKVCGGNVSWDE